MATRTLSNVSAGQQMEDGRHHGGVRRTNFTGVVELRGVPDWMKPGSPLVTAELTPAQARHLALELLQAAERAELVTR
jgi:hypothetical protein